MKRDNIMFSMTFPFEFRLVMSHYPILIYQDKESDKTFPIALYGFEERENLFLDESGWNARYLPVMVKRQPFLIGFQQQPDSDERAHVITFDPEHPRVNTEEGEAVFNEDGSHTPYLEKVIKMLESMDVGNAQNELLAQALKKHDLLEPSTIAITLKDGSKFELVGFSRHVYSGCFAFGECGTSSRLTIVAGRSARLFFILPIAVRVSLDIAL